MKAVIEGLRYIRRMNTHILGMRYYIEKELTPGTNVTTDEQYERVNF